MPRLSTHVLDTMHGRPASGVKIELFAVEADARTLVTTATTTGDGRTDDPLISGDRVGIGVYELVFHAGNYFRGLGLQLPDPAFLDRVVIRFGIADPAANHHIPLLLSPYGYSTYRGS